MAFFSLAQTWIQDMKGSMHTLAWHPLSYNPLCRDRKRERILRTTSCDVPHIFTPSFFWSQEEHQMLVPSSCHSGLLMICLSISLLQSCNLLLINKFLSFRSTNDLFIYSTACHIYCSHAIYYSPTEKIHITAHHILASPEKILWWEYNNAANDKVLFPPHQESPFTSYTVES
ncbi:unnamed protein product [Musa acuminata subsp. malaccensis]|uniref:(wild Malaysian banana) hypothetical protein n=1 Tax=Musa acuminata subsp. malaccensis TaxID=214687 RepID=A0A804JYK3_MUSAM|nr:unnamed protein product [Musa acuminata subsp. malaccensis]